MRHTKTTSCPIPVAANISIALAAGSTSLGLLWFASHTTEWWLVAVAAFVFSFTNNTVFSLLHEAVHGMFHPSRRINDWLGVVFASFFPTIFSIQRISHLGHHRRNRTDEELYDCYLPGQSWLLKTYWIYCLLTGFYWAIIPFAGLLYVIWPTAFRSSWFQNGPATWWGFKPFVVDIAAMPIGRAWLEGIFALSFQVAVITLLDISLLAWLACYWAFGINWSSVQYSDHAGSSRDVIEGAWNLRFTTVSQMLFLNYNLHLAHHREPGIPWRHLPNRVREDDPNPSFWPIYLRLFLGARPAPVGPGPTALPGPASPLTAKQSQPPLTRRSVQ